MKSHPPQSLPGVHASAGAGVESAPGQSLAGQQEVPASERDTATPIEDVEELTSRLPTSELIRIIKGALECGRRNLPFTQTDLLRTMTIPPPAMGGARAPRR